MNLRTPIVIIGFMACGKSEVARAVAKHLNVTMLDLDEVITSVEGRSPAELIREEGERSFRHIETANLERVLEANESYVIALGGGAWIEPTNRKLLASKGARTVWLNAPFDLCWERIESSSEDRPLGTSRDQAGELYRLRYPIYGLASMRIDVSAADSSGEIALRLLDELTQKEPRV